MKRVMRWVAADPGRYFWYGFFWGFLLAIALCVVADLFTVDA